MSSECQSLQLPACHVRVTHLLLSLGVLYCYFSVGAEKVQYYTCRLGVQLLQLRKGSVSPAVLINTSATSKYVRTACLVKQRVQTRKTPCPKRIMFHMRVQIGTSSHKLTKQSSQIIPSKMELFKQHLNPNNQKYMLILLAYEKSREMWALGSSPLFVFQQTYDVLLQWAYDCLFN